MRGSREAPNRLVSTSIGDVVETLDTQSGDHPRPHLLGAGDFGVRARLVGGHLDGAGDSAPPIDVAAGGEMDLGVRTLPRADAVIGDGDVEELVGGDVEPTPLQLVEQAEAGAADVGGVAPAHLVDAVHAAGRADAGGDRLVGRFRQRRRPPG